MLSVFLCVCSSLSVGVVDGYSRGWMVSVFFSGCNGNGLCLMEWQKMDR